MKFSKNRFFHDLCFAKFCNLLSTNICRKLYQSRLKQSICLVNFENNAFQNYKTEKVSYLKIIKKMRLQNMVLEKKIMHFSSIYTKKRIC